MIESVRAELLAMSERDQQIRNGLPRGPIPAGIATKWERLDRTHTARLKQLIAVHGWPGHALVGIDGAEAAWLLAQHADRDPADQHTFLHLLQRAVAAGDAEPRQLAYLIDRVAIAEGRPQTYGTQAQINDDVVTPLPIADPETVDQRRADVGLPPLADHLDEIARRHT